MLTDAQITGMYEQGPKNCRLDDFDSVLAELLTLRSAARSVLRALHRPDGLSWATRSLPNAIHMGAGHYKIEESLGEAGDDEERAALLAVVRLEDLVGEPWHKLRDQALPQVVLDAVTQASER